MGIGPGDFEPLTANSGAAQPNPDRVYILDTYHSQVEIGQQVRIVERDVSGEIITIHEIGTVSGRGAGYLVLATAMLGDYTLAGNAAVQTIVRMGPVSQPAYLDMQRRVEEVEDYIDHRTHHCWRQRVEVEWKEFYSSAKGAIYPHGYAMNAWKEYSTGWYVHLRHGSIKVLDDTIDTAYPGYQGDFLKIWRGGVYEDWVNAAEPDYVAGKVENRGTGDFWLDYDNGILYFVGDRPMRSDRAVKIRYRYGETMYPTDAVTGADVHGPGFRDIQKAARLLVQAEYLRNERFAVNFPGGSDEGAIGPLSASRDMTANAERILDLHTELIGWFGAI